jgi:hypothetical protein
VVLGRLRGVWARRGLALVVAVAAGTACTGGESGTGGTTGDGATPETTTTTTVSVSSPAPTTETPTTASATDASVSPATVPPACPRFSPPTATATLSDPRLVEVSGLAIGRNAPDVMWVHNDSGDAATIYAVAPDGTVAATATLTDTIALDIEDMAIGSDPRTGATYLYVGDIGDNLTIRPTVAIHRFVEPDASAAETAVSGERLILSYPEGPRDAEALIVDAAAGEVVIITKQQGEIYTAPVAAFETGRTELTLAGTLTAGTGVVTAGSMDGDGSRIAVRTTDRVLLWLRAEAQTVAAALQTVPCELPAPEERQGEAIGLNWEGNRYVTISEGRSAEIFVSTVE